MLLLGMQSTDYEEQMQCPIKKVILKFSINY